MRRILLLLLLVSCAPVKPASPASPSIEAPPSAISSSPSPSKFSPAASSQPRCKQSQLRAAITRSEGAGGHTGSFLIVFNPSSDSCSIMGPGTLELRDRKGTAVSRSQGKRPFIAGFSRTPHMLAVDAGTGAEDESEKRRVFTFISQGSCPGGVFPPNGRLFLIVSDIGAVEIQNFSGPLPFDYRCDGSPPSPSGPPELLIGDLRGTVGDEA